MLPAAPHCKPKTPRKPRLNRPRKITIKSKQPPAPHNKRYSKPRPHSKAHKSKANKVSNA